MEEGAIKYYQAKNSGGKTVARITNTTNSTTMPSLVYSEEEFSYETSSYGYGTQKTRYTYNKDTDTVDYYSDDVKYISYTRLTENVQMVGCILDNIDNITFNSIIGKEDGQYYLYLNSNIDMEKNTATITAVDGTTKTVTYDGYYYSTLNWPVCSLGMEYGIDTAGEYTSNNSNGRIELSNTLFDGQNHTIFIKYTCYRDGGYKTALTTINVDPTQFYGVPTILEAVTDGNMRLVGSVNFKYQINNDVIGTAEWYEVSGRNVKAGDIIKVWMYDEQNGSIANSNVIIGTGTTAKLKIKSWSTSITQVQNVNPKTGSDADVNGGLVEVESWIGLENCTSFNGAFNTAILLTTIPSSWRGLENVTDMSYAFQDCDKLAAIPDSFDGLENVTNTSYMFRNSDGTNRDQCFTMVYSWSGLSNVTNAEYMFYGNTNIIRIPSYWEPFNKLENAEGMFYGCTNLENIGGSAQMTSSDANEMSNLKNVKDMFNECVNANTHVFECYEALSEIIGITNHQYTFYNCGSIGDPDAYNSIPHDWGGPYNG